MSSNSNLYKGQLYVLIAAMGFGIVPLLAKFSFNGGMNSETMLTYRFLIAGSFFIIFTLKKGLKIYIDLKTTIKLSCIGVLYAIEAACYFEAYRYISPSLGELLFLINPIFITLGAYIVFKERISKDNILALGVTLTGCILLFWEPSSFVTMHGVALILLAVIFYTTYVLIGKKVLKDIDPIIVTTYTTLGCGVTLLIYSLLTGKLIKVNDISMWGVILTLSIFSTIISLLFFAKGLKVLGASKAAILSTVEPVVTVFLSFVIYHETLNVHQVLGGVLIVLSIVVVEGKLTKNKVIVELEKEPA